FNNHAVYLFYERHYLLVLLLYNLFYALHFLPLLTSILCDLLPSLMHTARFGSHFIHPTYP
ncbi:MAG: hypothetical protein OCU24_07370, partial [Candidatus Methanospirare jalkutatii]|nr:hypothetical protein [Candidatus Methanospirare jalkutatii]